MNVLVVGSGGREHAICKSLRESQHLNHLYCLGTHNNPGIFNLVDALFVESDSKNLEYVLNKYRIDCVIPGPEKPPEKNIADRCYKKGIGCVGPTSDYATIETCKNCARTILDQLFPDVNPRYKLFNPLDPLVDIRNYLETFHGNYVIKANGLKGGKGVKVAKDHLSSIEDAIHYIQVLQNADDYFIIEEKLKGHEFSLMSFSDGTHVSHMPIVRDFKRAYEGDQGPNTGGMGSISFANHSQPFLTKEDIQQCQHINETIIRHLKERYGGLGYRGILYGGFMKTWNHQIKVIEFNSRFGDPESINVLSLLETDLLDICSGILHGTLDQVNVSYKPLATVCRYFVPHGYPEHPIKHHEIYIHDGIDQSTLFYASAEYGHDQHHINHHYIYQLGSRTLALLGLGETLQEACSIVKKNEKHVQGPLFHRSDIGTNVTDMDSTHDAYTQAGVDIQKGNAFLKKIKPMVESTFDHHVLGSLGDFSGIYQLGSQYLVSSTDGVGTKSIFVKDYLGTEGFKGLGMDLVNHCVNDILVCGATPLFFLDYFASARLELAEACYFIQGVTTACREHQCVLIGGETAEMPDVYHPGRVDLVGTIVGSLSSQPIHGKTAVRENDVVIGLMSSGPHTNGFSLIRNIFRKLGTPEENLRQYAPIISKLCQPHRSYFQEIQKLISHSVDLHGLCHVTGGGFIDNPKRILPAHVTIQWIPQTFTSLPGEFQFLKDKGNLTDYEMMHTFNCGIGMLIVVDHASMASVLDILNRDESLARQVGTVVPK